MFNAFEDGYAKGKEDGFHSKSQNIQRHLHPLKAFCSSEYVLSFGKGYRTGYVTGKKQKEYDLNRERLEQERENKKLQQS